MAKVGLKVNMIIEGHFYPFGSVLDEKMIPERLRKSRYIGEPGTEDDEDEIETIAETESEIELEEERKPPIQASVKRRRL